MHSAAKPQSTYIPVPRVQQCLSPRWNWDPPPPLPKTNVYPPPPRTKGGGNALA